VSIETTNPLRINSRSLTGLSLWPRKVFVNDVFSAITQERREEFKRLRGSAAVV
jgi:hypothetical protein